MSVVDSDKKQPIWPLMAVIGRRVFVSFFLVTFVVVAILAATNVVSKHALKSYTEDQIDRIHWDAVVYQSSFPEKAALRNELSKFSEIKVVRESGSMKLSLGSFLHINVGGQATDIPWFMMMSAEEPTLLPPELRPSSGESLAAIVGPQLMIGSYSSKIGLGDSVDIVYTDPVQPGPKVNLFSGMITQLSTPDRLELVKFFLDRYGSASFIPDGCLIFVVPQKLFDQEVPRITTLVHKLSKPAPMIGVGEEEGQAAEEPKEENAGAMIINEFVYLISLDRRNLFTGWDLEGSYSRTSGLISEIKNTATAASFDNLLNSELMVTLEKMARVSRQIVLLTVLISFPILWLAWLFAGNLSHLIILNQRRLVGLLRLRGASYGSIQKVLLVAIGAGGLVGGLVGALVGTFLPYSLYRVGGVEIPLRLLFVSIQPPWVLTTFIVLGTAFGLLAGRTVTRYMAKITPVEASRRVASQEPAGSRYRLTETQLLLLLLGSTKIVAWSVGFTPKTMPLKTVDSFLNFVGAAFFLYGFAALLTSRRKRLETLLSSLARPLARNLHWFTVQTMLNQPERTLTVILLAALTFGVVVYPQVTSRSFYDKMVRALRLNLGSDIALQFEATELAGPEVRLRPIREYLDIVGKKVENIAKEVQTIDGVRSWSPLYEFSIPGSFYIHGQNYLNLFLIERPDQFLQKVYYENRLGVEKPFRALLGDLGKDDVLVSEGLRSALSEAASKPLGLGSGGITARVAGTIYLLPGLSQFQMQDRESFSSASVEFLNSITRTQPYVVGRMDSETIPRLQGSLSSVVLHIGGNQNVEELAKRLVALREQGKIPPFRSINTEAAGKDSLGSDMFVYMALENIKVFMIGGIFVTLAGLVAAAIVNFIEGKRIFALLRLRGASPKDLIRVILTGLVAPLFVGAGIGVPVGLVTGYGLTNAIFALPRAASVLEILPVHLTLSWFMAGIILFVLTLFFFASLVLSAWIFRRTAREALGD